MNTITKIALGSIALGAVVATQASACGGDLCRGIRDLGKSVNDANNHLHNEIGKIERGAKRDLQNLETEFCDVMTGGRYKKGEAGCSGDVGGKTGRPSPEDPSQPRG